MITKPNFSLFDLSENDFGFLFFNKQIVMWKKNEQGFPHTLVHGKRENAYFYEEAATGKRQIWQENHVFA